MKCVSSYLEMEQIEIADLKKQHVNFEHDVHKESHDMAPYV